MQISGNEIAHVEEVGSLNGEPVKAIRTKGGFWILVGRSKNKGIEEALTAGSHIAIAKYNLEQQYPEFQPAMMKSENLSDNTVVERHSHFLSEDLRKSGHDIYSVQNGSMIDFQVTKHNATVATVAAEIEGGSLVIRDLVKDRQFTKAIAGATSEKAMMCGAKSVKVEGKVK